jgi:hypothetical protein
MGGLPFIIGSPYRISDCSALAVAEERLDDCEQTLYYISMSPGSLFSALRMSFPYAFTDTIDFAASSSDVRGIVQTIAFQQWFSDNEGAGRAS